jgi:hypothetical protein
MPLEQSSTLASPSLQMTSGLNPPQVPKGCIRHCGIECTVALDFAAAGSSVSDHNLMGFPPCPAGGANNA